MLVPVGKQGSNVKFPISKLLETSHSKLLVRPRTQDISTDWTIRMDQYRIALSLLVTPLFLRRNFLGLGPL